MNAALQVQGKDPWTPRRDEAYIGVLIDDLITCGTQEPYRMFTSRAEYRLMLREDNADLRLTETGCKLGLIDDERWRMFDTKRHAIEAETQRLRDIWVRPESLPAETGQRVLGQPLSRESTLLDLLRRPDVSYQGLMSLPGVAQGVVDEKVAEQVEIQAKYSGYIQRQQDEIARQRRHEDTLIPVDFDYHAVKGLSAEVQEKLLRVHPETIGQASRIPGVTPAAISLLLVYLKKKQWQAEQKRA